MSIFSKHFLSMLKNPKGNFPYDAFRLSPATRAGSQLFHPAVTSGSRGKATETTILHGKHDSRVGRRACKH